MKKHRRLRNDSVHFSILFMFVLSLCVNRVHLFFMWPCCIFNFRVTQSTKQRETLLYPSILLRKHSKSVFCTHANRAVCRWGYLCLIITQYPFQFIRACSRSSFVAFHVLFTSFHFSGESVSVSVSTAPVCFFELFHKINGHFRELSSLTVILLYQLSDNFVFALAFALAQLSNFS